MKKIEYYKSLILRRKGFTFQLLKSHLLVASIGLVILLLSLVFTYYLRVKVVNLAEKGAPIAQASSNILTEVQRSFADVRGWVSLGDKSFLNEWKKTWNEGITPALNFLIKQERQLKKDMSSLQKGKRVQNCFWLRTRLIAALERNISKPDSPCASS